MAKTGRFPVAVPAGAEDDYDSEDDDFGTSWVSRPSESFSRKYEDGSGDASQRSFFGSKPTDHSCGISTTIRSKDDSVEDFRRALAANKLEIVKAMLTENFDVNATSRSGWSPLMFAVDVGNLQVSKILLEKGANPKHHIDSFSVLMASCKCRGDEASCLAIVKTLIEDHESDPKAKDRYHTTPLMYAAMEGHVQVVRYLLENGRVEVDAFDARGHTALMLAVKGGRAECVKELISAGADRDKMNVEGKTSKDLALDGGDVVVINILHDRSKLQSSVSALDSYNGITLYGELESFFYGLQLNDLIDVFKEQRISFKQLLLLSEADLLHLGVKMGDVKKISEAIHAVHKQPWNKSSLQQFDPKSRNVLKCSEAAAIVSNLAKHASLMCSSIGYASDQIKTHSSVLETGIDNQAALQLRQGVAEALSNVRALERELIVLDQTVNETDVVELCLPVDEINNNDKGSAPKFRRRGVPWIVGVAGFVAVLGSFYIRLRN